MMAAFAAPMEEPANHSGIGPECTCRPALGPCLIGAHGDAAREHHGHVPLRSGPAQIVKHAEFSFRKVGDVRLPISGRVGWG